MIIQHKQKEGKGMFFVAEDKEILAELVYSIPSSDKIILEHTEVDDALKGQNIGQQLIQAAVKFARQTNIKIIPVCSFAKAIFDKKPEFRDVLGN